MDYCRICTQHYISRYICRRQQLHIQYIAITSESNQMHLSNLDIIDYELLKPILQHYDKSPQKYSWCIVTFLKENGLKSQAIWSQHDQKSTLIHCL
jgi:hypothetical protein